MTANIDGAQPAMGPEVAFDAGKAAYDLSTTETHKTTLPAEDVEPSSLSIRKDNTTNSEAASTKGDVDKEEEESSKRPKGLKFALLYTCLLLGCFLTGYDNSCIATLAPVITDDYHALNNLGWYAIAYLLAMSASMLIYGKLYSYYSMKRIFMGSFSVFILGSIVTATAPTSPAFIVGRALSGLGSAGMFSGATIIIANTTSLRHRATYTAMCGGVECSALALGPLISGAIAHYSSWRICFYICIPMGVLILATVFICVGDLRRPENAHLSGKEKIERLDLVGIAISVPMTLCLVLAMQWAGTTYAWSSWKIILLLALFAVLLLTFLFVEHRGGEMSMLPLKMLRQRSVALSSIVTFCNVGSLSVIAYYIAIYFQAVRGATTLGSGLMYLPMAVSMAITAMAAGPITSFIGYSNPNLIAGSILEVVGAGLLTTITPDTPAAQWIGYQIIYGVGVSLAFQAPYIAVQAALPASMVPTALVSLGFTQIAGGIIVLSIAQNVFLTRLSHNLAAAVPSLEPSAILHNGALSIITSVPQDYREAALRAYNGTIVNVFYISLGLSCVIAVSSLFIEWKSVKGEKKKEEETTDV